MSDTETAVQPKPKRMRASDISDERLMAAVDDLVREDKARGDAALSVTRWDVQSMLAGSELRYGRGLDSAEQDEEKARIEAAVPGKVVLAKMRRLENRRLIVCCSCGCRGDIYLTKEGRDVLKAFDGRTPIRSALAGQV